MKAKKMNCRTTVKHYPNEAEPGYFLRQFAENLLCAVGSMGIVTLLFFMAITF